jgi:hypothetical protein
MTHATRISSGGVFLLFLCGTNLLLMALAVFYRRNHDLAAATVPSPPTGSHAWGIALASASQVLYVGLALSWAFRGNHFYPGNPYITPAVLVGLLLSASAAACAFFENGYVRFAVLFVAVTSAGLWLLSALASVAL